MQQLSNPSESKAGGNGARAASPARLAVSPEAVGVLPAEFVKRHRVLPLRLSHGTILIATAEPGNQRVIDDIRLLTGLEVEEQVAGSGGIAGKDRRVLPGDGRADDRESEPGPDATAAEGKNLHDIEVMANEPTVINLVNLIISTALRERASDIHLVPFEDTLQLRYRDGRAVAGEAAAAQASARRPGFAHQDHGGHEHRRAVHAAGRAYPDQSSRRARGHPGGHHAHDLRRKPGHAVAGKELQVADPRGTGLGRASARNCCRRLVEKPHGLFLATGPTGSGKTTTLYSILQSIYTPEKKI